jgi:broad specificity phosphatase PhoE
MHKWPQSITMIRHGETVYNLHKTEKVERYPEFKKLFDEEFAKLTTASFARGQFPSPELKELAIEVLDAYTPNHGDFDTELTDWGFEQARQTGVKLHSRVPLPKTIYVSPYRRTKETLRGLIEGWPELKDVRVSEDDRIREREHGKQAIFGDWRLMYVFNPQQGLLYKLSSQYEFRQEGGESILDVRKRTRDFVTMLIREHGGVPQVAEIQPIPEDVLAVTHSLTILAMKANFERWNREEFLHQYKNNFPLNCGVSIYRAKESDPGRSRQGSQGRMELAPEDSNIKLWEDRKKV